LLPYLWALKQLDQLVARQAAPVVQLVEPLVLVLVLLRELLLVESQLHQLQ
jgi:hypothetical protein